MKKGAVIFWAVVAFLIVAGIGVSVLPRSSGPSKLDSFAQCIKAQGVVYYGAFWCPHCKATNALFGSSKKYLPYVECSTPDGQNQLQICKDKNVQSYPTWTRPSDETRLTGERTLQELSDFSGCPLPQ